jgi:transcription termination/antitermination protein NusG
VTVAFESDDLVSTAAQIERPNPALQRLTGPVFPLSSTLIARRDARFRWYAVYTKSRHEKRIKEQLDHRSIESFLPLYEAIHRWKDRRVTVSLPVFPGYLFVRISLPEHRLPVVAVPGIVSLVGALGCPTPIADREIEVLKVCSMRGYKMVPYPYLVAGGRVRVHNGPLADLEGILLRRRGKSRLILSVKLIARSVAVEVDAADVAPVSAA